MILFPAFGRLMLSVVVGGEASELFFVLAYSVGDGFDGGAQGGDLVGEPGEGAAGGGLVAVLVDDRPLSPGVRFADADLVGVPVRVTIGKRLQTEGTVEVRLRSSADRETVALADALPRILALAAEA